MRLFEGYVSSLGGENACKEKKRKAVGRPPSEGEQSYGVDFTIIKTREGGGG